LLASGIRVPVEKGLVKRFDKLIVGRILIQILAREKKCLGNVCARESAS